MKQKKARQEKGEDTKREDGSDKIIKLFQLKTLNEIQELAYLDQKYPKAKDLPSMTLFSQEQLTALQGLIKSMSAQEDESLEAPETSNLETYIDTLNE